MADTIHQEISLDAAPDRVYEAFMDSKQHSEFTGGAETTISNEIGGPFSCHGGQITGRNIELVPGKRIVQAWRADGWEDGLYSVVRMELSEDNGRTSLVLDHTGFPDGAKEMLEQGWNMRYWEPMNRFLS